MITHSIALNGITAVPFTADVSLGGTAPITGLSEAQCREVSMRARSAISQLTGAPSGKLSGSITGPYGSACGLAIAVSALGINAGDTRLIGELSFVGEVRPVRGILPRVLGATHDVIVPAGNAPEAASAQQILRDRGSNVTVYVASTLQDVVMHLTSPRGAHQDIPVLPSLARYVTGTDTCDFRDVRGHVRACRALEVAAATRKNILVVGPAGCGRTMLARLARRAGTLLPPMTQDERIEASCVHSVAGVLSPHTGMIDIRPFRAPHHTVSDAGLYGGGVPSRPGEVSLAHGGVLFLDELNEFRRTALDGLRSFLKAGKVTLHRSGVVTRFPAKPWVIGAMAPCPCGSGATQCRCTEDQKKRWRARGLEMARGIFEMYVEIEPADLKAPFGESSAEIRGRIAGGTEKYDASEFPMPEA